MICTCIIHIHVHDFVYDSRPVYILYNGRGVLWEMVKHRFMHFVIYHTATYYVCVLLQFCVGFDTWCASFRARTYMYMYTHKGTVVHWWRLAHVHTIGICMASQQLLTAVWALVRCIFHACMASWPGISVVHRGFYTHVGMYHIVPSKCQTPFIDCMVW